MNKRPSKLPGNVINTPELKKLYNKDYMAYLKEYQKQLLNNVKRTPKW